MQYQQCLLTLSALLFGVAVPVLEIDSTHVFNPAWPPHARLHEVWQLATNSMIAIFCGWRIWRYADVRLPALLTLLVTGGFFIAWLTRDSYGGSMLHSDGTERLLFGINVGVLGFGITGLTALGILMIDYLGRSGRDGQKMSSSL